MQLIESEFILSFLPVFLCKLEAYESLPLPVIFALQANQGLHA